MIDLGGAFVSRDWYAHRPSFMGCFYCFMSGKGFGVDFSVSIKREFSIESFIQIRQPQVIACDRNWLFFA